MLALIGKKLQFLLMNPFEAKSLIYLEFGEEWMYNSIIGDGITMENLRINLK